MSNITSPTLRPGYVSEYSGTTAIVVASVFIPLQIFFVCLRAFSRSLAKADVGADDVLVWASLVTCIALDAYGIALIKFAGAGRHISALHALGKDDTIVLWSKMILGAEWLYFMGVALPKLCILTLYLRIFANEFFRAVSYAMATIIICNCLVNGLTGTLSCPTMIYFGEDCDFNTTVFVRWASLPNIITDVVMLILPLPTIWSLHLPTIQKIGLTVTFVMGSIGLIASCFRFATFFVNIKVDPIYSSGSLFVWTIIEPGMYLIAACLLRLRPLLQLILKSAWIERMLTRKIASHPNVQVSQPIRAPRDMMAAHTRGGINLYPQDTGYSDECGMRASQFYDRGMGSNSTFIGSHKSLGSKQSSDHMPVTAACPPRG